MDEVGRRDVDAERKFLARGGRGKLSVFSEGKKAWIGGE